MRHSNRSGCRFRVCSAHHPTTRPHTDRPAHNCGSRCTTRISVALRLPGEAAAHPWDRRGRRAGRDKPCKQSRRSPCECRPQNVPRCWCWQDHRCQVGGRRQTYMTGTPRNVPYPATQAVLSFSSPDSTSAIPTRIRLVGGCALQSLPLRVASPRAIVTGRGPASVVRSLSS